ncbi:MAG: hypothetical protein IJ470_03725 [Clostridia bacterium]|nr:hypothetical protein [Clostridia bacterium]
MEKSVLPQKTLLLWKIRFSVPAIVMVVLSFFLCRFSSLFIIVPIFLTVLALLILFIYIPVYFRRYEILCGENAVIINRGVLIKTTHIMPYSRMIYAQTFTTPLAFAFKLSAVTLKSARSFLFIPEIDRVDAESIILAVCGEEKE